MDYNREQALNYTHTWAFRRNPSFADFEEMGGDCTNFVSQCLLAGGASQIYSPLYGWYFRNLYDRAPAWSGVDAFYRFIKQERKTGPYAIECKPEEVIPGDIVQFATAGSRFHHAAIIVDITGKPITTSNIKIACHSFDSDYRPLSTYNIRMIRYLHIVSV